MYRGQRISRMLMEKERMDNELMCADRSGWYSVDKSLLPLELVENFYQFFFDDETQVFLNKSLETSNSICLQFYYALASTLLSFFITKTSINGLLDRGGMFVFPREQLRSFLDLPSNWEKEGKKLLDLGAGDGQVTEVLAQFYGNVSTTEASKVMEWRLQQRGFAVVDKDSWSQTGTYELVSALNLLDRHYDPHALLADLHSLTVRSDCLLLMAVVLPLSQYVEFHPNSKLSKPDVFLYSKGHAFEEQVSSLVENVFIPAGFEVVRWGKLPYLCEGDYYQAYYQLSDAIFLLRPLTRTVLNLAGETGQAKPGFIREKDAL